MQTRRGEADRAEGKEGEEVTDGTVLRSGAQRVAGLNHGETPEDTKGMATTPIRNDYRCRWLYQIYPFVTL